MQLHYPPVNPQLLPEIPVELLGTPFFAGECKGGTRGVRGVLVYMQYSLRNSKKNVDPLGTLRVPILTPLKLLDIF